MKTEIMIPDEAYISEKPSTSSGNVLKPKFARKWVKEIQSVISSEVSEIITIVSTTIGSFALLLSSIGLLINTASSTESVPWLLSVSGALVPVAGASWFAQTKAKKKEAIREKRLELAQLSQEEMFENWLERQHSVKITDSTKKHLGRVTLYWGEEGADSFLPFCDVEENEYKLFYKDGGYRLSRVLTKPLDNGRIIMAGEKVANVAALTDKVHSFETKNLVREVDGKVLRLTSLLLDAESEQRVNQIVQDASKAAEAQKTMETLGFGGAHVETTNNILELLSKELDGILQRNAMQIETQMNVHSEYVKSRQIEPSALTLNVGKS